MLFSLQLCFTWKKPYNINPHSGSSFHVVQHGITSKIGICYIYAMKSVKQMIKTCDYI